MTDKQSLIPVVDEPWVTIKLRKPIEVKDEKLEEIQFREATAGDIIRNGNPVIFDGFAEEYNVRFDDQKMVKMLGVLSNNMPRFVFDRMAPNDYVDCCWAVAPLFVPWINR